jgi:phosphatidylglycerol lysyltransferase
VDRLRGLLRRLPAFLGLFLLAGAVWVVWKEFRHLRLADVGRAMSAIPERALLLSLGFTVVSYAVLTLYDRLGTIYAGHRVSYRRAAFASFCAYALSHNLGFAAVSGAAVRYRLYAHWGLTPLQIAKVVAFCSLTFGLGGMVLGGVILFAEPGAVPFLGHALPHWVLYAAGGLLWAVVAAYVSVARFVGVVRLFGHEVELPGFRMALRQVALATADVGLTAAIFYALLPVAPGLTFPRFLGIYVASYSAGLLASLPGGIGVFDTAMLLGLEPHLAPPQILGAIVVFRLYYYIIPLFLAGSLFAGNEVLLRGGTWLRRGRAPAARLAQPGKPARSTPLDEPGLAVVAATGAVALCGALLLGLGVLDQQPDLGWMDPDLAGVATEAGAFLPSLAGAALLVVATGLAQRVALARRASVGLLLIAAGFTAAQGAPWWIAAVLGLTALLLAPLRDAFYRDARLLAGPMEAGTAVPLFTLAGCLLALAAFQPAMRQVGGAGESWWAIVLSPDMPNRVRVSVLLVVTVMLVALWRLLRPGRVEVVPWAGGGRLRYAALGVLPPAQADGMVMGEAGRAGIAFRRHGRVLLGLGDPAGAPSDRVSAIWRLRDLAQREGRDPAVWRAGRDLLHVYGDLGLAALPLGPDGLPLPERLGDAPPVAHYLCCVAERDLKLLLPLLPALAEERRLMRAAAE